MLLFKCELDIHVEESAGKMPNHRDGVLNPAIAIKSCPAASFRIGTARSSSLRFKSDPLSEFIDVKWSKLKIWQSEIRYVSNS